ncbi:low temperature requirement protein A [Micromonospora avicenniae]|uniref:Low temperature requirement protein LtrA n=1 Tax=Micromonospora avicenniae TaxID=1198245 RepID=A0A1N7EKF0_9ACTN|nr:low temperature requirement protein A [Micromonospora avicenniae]SIR88570.1 Low temperature requirement protein LtrA [Micromonospora avicenniae]
MRRWQKRTAGWGRRVLGRPMATGDEAGHRHATWFELFFDVIFVFALAAVVDRLGEDTTPRPSSVITVFGLFLVVQWAWVGHAYYATRYEADDLSHRLLLLLALLGAGAITLGVDEVPTGEMLPVGYLIVRGVLLLLYLRGRPDTEVARMGTRVYLIGFGLGWLIWLASLAAPGHLRPAFWITGTAIELVTPWFGYRWLSRWPVDVRHLPERVGQFIIIVLGSTVANLLATVPNHPDQKMALTAALAFTVPAAIWWIYATFVTSGIPIHRLRGGQPYAYLHYLLGGGLLLLGWALGQAVRTVHRDEALTTEVRLLLAGSITLWLLCGLGLYWLAIRVSPGATLLAAYGIGSAWAITLMVSSPFLLLVLLCAAIVGYAVLFTFMLARERIAPGTELTATD